MKNLNTRAQLLIFVFLFLLVFGPVTLAEKALHSPKEIQESIRYFVEESVDSDADRSVEISVNPLDRRLRLPLCDQPLELNWAPGARKVGNSTVGVRCTGTSPWKIYHSVHIAKFETVWVAQSSILKNSLISTEQLEEKSIDTSKFHRRYISSKQSVSGFRSKRDIRPGEFISLAMLEKDTLVKRGDRVTIVVLNNGIEVRAAATAMTAAATGDRVTVRNLKTKKEVEGILTSDFMVYIHL